MTLSDSNGNICSTWEFNFSDFDLKKDPHVESSINLLRSNGLDFEKIRRDGIEGRVFVGKFLEILSRHRNLKWVTFHGLYDLAYMLKLLSGNPLPGSVFDFIKLASGYFEYVYDIKFMARFCDGLMGGELGLNRAAKILNLERSGDAHNAGSDSLLTAAVFARMRKMYRIDERFIIGFLYGISARIPIFRREMMVPLHCHPYVPPPSCPRVVYCGRPLLPQPHYYVPVQLARFPC
ncbi:Ribonuclease CAF1 [Melia azedarach]|uniref:Ribonuclease CAF1 n=1 Tax=Melia azedarach TaxID=155640 RepID=A0ACC1Y697_MELAZ|nr:Ribonuclease CAF1 [Melia azedarach]